MLLPEIYWSNCSSTGHCHPAGETTFAAQVPQYASPPVLLALQQVGRDMAVSCSSRSHLER